MPGSVTTGTISFVGVTVNSVPVVGSINAPELQVNGSVTLGGVFNPLNVDSTECNLGGSSGEASFAASISGTLEPQTSLDWSVYYDPTNEPLGEATLLFSKGLSNPSSLTPIGFFVPPVTISGPIEGPFSLTEVLTISGPSGGGVTFDSSVIARVPEASTWTMMLMGFVGCSLLFRRTKRRRIAAA